MSNGQNCNTIIPAYQHDNLDRLIRRYVYDHGCWLAANRSVPERVESKEERHERGTFNELNAPARTAHLGAMAAVACDVADILFAGFSSVVQDAIKRDIRESGPGMGAMVVEMARVQLAVCAG